jgi:hypothetical protein
MTAAAVVAVLFFGGVLGTFVGTGVRGRVIGLSGMAVAAVLALVAGAPRQAAAWWMALPAGLTLAAMVRFAIGLSRRLAHDGGEASLDDERW